MVPCDVIIEAPAKPTSLRPRFLRGFGAFPACPSVGGRIITRKRQADVLEMDTAHPRPDFPLRLRAFALIIS
jgi:hypothetical protein